jgi:OHCU decarboxylase
MNQSLTRLNQLPSQVAEAEFLKCCGSMNWARRMSDTRPFADFNHLTKEADRIWRSLTDDDWLEAFRAHPKIGEKKAEATQSARAQGWSAQEQSKSQKTTEATKVALAQGNREYAERFGFIFIICASGKSGEEILRALRARLVNERQDELRVAAEEQRKITQLRLQKLIDN